MDKIIGKTEKLWSNNGFVSNLFGTSNGDHRSELASRDAVSSTVLHTATSNTRGSVRCDTSTSTIGSTSTDVGETFEIKNFDNHFTLGRTIERGEHWEMVEAVTNNFPGSMPYTVKKVRRWGFRNNDLRKKAFFREVDILKKLDHAHVVKIFHFFPYEMFHFYAVLEHLDGGELLVRVAEKERYSEMEARALCLTIMKTIHYVHSKNVVHRDIKPGSFVFTNPGEIKPGSFVFTNSGERSSLKLTGFGKACSLDDGLVVTPVSCGEELVAPEILKEEPHGKSVDMWNIGCVVHYLIAGRKPLFERKKTETYGKLSLTSENWRKTSQEAKDFVSALLERNLDTRMNARKAIKHRWLSMEGKSLDSNDLGQSLKRKMLHNAKRKLMIAIRLYVNFGRLSGKFYSRDSQDPDFLRAYELGEFLGKGAFAHVYRATLKPREGDQPKDVAVKRMVRRRKRQVFNEVCILASLDHPNVIKMHNFYHDDPKYYYIVLELMKGGELFDQIQKKTCFKEEEARDACRVLLEALEHIHTNGVAHRDLKPENILLASESDCTSIRIADFGFACDASDNTASGCCGTPHYKAPEVVRRALYGTPVDMWSMGVVIFYMLSGEQPFDYRRNCLRGHLRQGHNKIYADIKRGRFNFDPLHWCNVSEDAKDLICGLFKIDPKTRLTARQALEHSWLRRDGRELVRNNLSSNLERLRVFNAKRKMRAVIHTILASRRMEEMLEEETLGGVEVKCE